jgi:hypothetical protein
VLRAPGTGTLPSEVDEMPTATARRIAVSAALLLLLACEGRLEGGPARPAGTTPVTPTACDLGVPEVAPAPLRRLTTAQYRNTVRDLLGDAEYAPVLDDDAPVITERGVRQLRNAAELAVERRASWSRAVFPCDTSGAADDACMTAFVDAFAPRAFRRPITDEDRAALDATYRSALGAGLSFGDAMEILLEVILQSPELVYLEEHGEPGATGAIRPLTQHELATRLSYFLWDTMPDDALFAAAERGALDDAGVRAEAERMLDDPRAEAALQGFFWRWLQLDGGRLHHALEETPKSPELYPEWTPELRAAMRTEIEALVRDTFARGGSFEELLTTRRAYVNGPLAELYGVPDGPTGATEWAWVDLDPATRSGLLTRAAFLSVFSSATVQSPIRRGVFVLEELFCTELGEPPPNASDVSVEGGEVETETGERVVRSVREDVLARTSGGTCAACHGTINPVGFTFEHYDGLGRHRTEELTSGRPIDARGALSGTDVDGELRDATELGARIASSGRARTCFADRFFRRAMGRAPGALDTCSVEEVSERFRETGSMRDLLIAIGASDSFRHLNVAGEVGR